MIVGKQKPFEVIWDMIKEYKKVLIFGCNTCVAICHEGGNKEAEILASMLRMKAKQEGLEMEIKNRGIERQCEHEFFDSANEQIEWADAVLSIACGAGVQFTAEKWPKKIILPGLNTTFIGVVERPGLFAERCLMCGDCILHLTGGLCPIARCSKSLLNGPCGGSSKGKCEISKEVDCVWDMIVRKKMEQGRLEDLLRITPAKDWQTSRDGGPRKSVKEGLVE
ncbi:MAG: methylenetetrahydrofolate reductase C-terminal domain-containing protein [Deltaproteobacteria bacterium]|nr:methylenetetrahydrofolate reductase C-terminal domain-containing protein [Deltaproteobacteria bacterium]